MIFEKTYPIRKSRKKSIKGGKLKFSNRVLDVVKEIPKGETLTYKEVAELAGSPRSWRAVGNILNKNKNPQIPCHRVVRSDGKAGGYNKGEKKKKYLLKKEGVILR